MRNGAGSRAPVLPGERVDDLAAAQRPPRRLVAQDEAVAAHRHDRRSAARAAPTLPARRNERTPVVQEHDATQHLGSPDVDTHALVALQPRAARRAHLDPGVERIGGPRDARIADHVAARDVAVIRPRPG